MGVEQRCLACGMVVASFGHMLGRIPEGRKSFGHVAHL